MEKVKLASTVASFLEKLLTRAQVFQKECGEGTLSLHTHTLLQLFVDSRGGESFATLNDSTAREELKALREDLEECDTGNVEDAFVRELFPLLDKHYEEIKNASVEAIVYAFVCTHYSVGERTFLECVPSKEEILKEIAEYYSISARQALHLVQDFIATHDEKFNLYKWRDYHTMDEFEEFAEEEISRGVGG